MPQQELKIKKNKKKTQEWFSRITQIFVLVPTQLIGKQTGLNKKR